MPDVWANHKSAEATTKGIAQHGHCEAGTPDWLIWIKCDERILNGG